MTLVILAAGMGSRYGGLKQIDPLGPGGEFIIDYSIYDAIQAGFDHVVFIIKREHFSAFEETVGGRIRSRIKVDYSFQELCDIPKGYTVPEGRVKPWGTSHALLCARDAVGSDRFAVINADDFYGRDSFRKMAEFLRTLPEESEKQHYCMCGFVLKNTLSENGTVARGICEVDENDMLLSVTERTKIQRLDGKTQFFEEDTGWTEIPEETPVSMNMWGFPSSIFRELEERSYLFFSNLKNPLKDEYLLPTVVGDIMREDKADVRVLHTDAKWYGVTYKEDRPLVQQFISNIIAAGEYPERLWNN